MKKLGLIVLLAVTMILGLALPAAALAYDGSGDHQDFHCTGTADLFIEDSLGETVLEVHRLLDFVSKHGFSVNGTLDLSKNGFTGTLTIAFECTEILD